MSRPRISGSPSMSVQVVEVGPRMAIVKDQFNRTRYIRSDVRRGNGAIPKVGEVWLIDQAFGEWTFAAVINPSPPPIFGSTDNNPALISLIDALTTLGLIDDQSDNTQLRAIHTHTHETDTDGDTGPDTEEDDLS